jgi:PAS domain S-box-containing protein
MALAARPSNVSAFCPVTGIAAGIMIVFGRRACPALVIGLAAGAVAASLVSDKGLLPTMLRIVCSAAEAVIVAWLLERWFGRGFAFSDLPRVAGFLTVAGMAAAASAAGGAAMTTLLNPAAPFWDVWRVWFLSNGIGIVVVAPLVIELARAWREPPSRREMTEGVAVLGLLALVAIYVHTHPTSSWISFSPDAFTLPPLLWLAVRCSPPFAMAGSFVVSISAICTTTLGIGHLSDAGLPIIERVHGVQTSVLVTTAYTLVLIALFSERRLRAALLERSNEQLRNQEGAFRRLLGALPAAIHTTDTAGRITYYNNAAADLWGVNPELHKDKCSDLGRLYYADGTLVPPDECPTRVCLVEGRAIAAREALFERPDGTRIAIIPYPAPLTDERGNVVGVVSMKIDISERKRTQAQLAEREAQLRLFVEHAPVAIAMFDREMRYLAVSRRFIVDFRLPPDAQLIGRSHYAMFPEIPQRWRDIHTRVLAGEEFFNEEDEFTRRDGRTDWTRWSMAPWRGGDGRIHGAVLFVEVRTEQVEAQRALTDSESRFRATFENAAVGVALVSSDGSILRANDSFARMLGYAPDELRSQTFQDLTHPEDLAANLSVLNKTLIGETDTYCIEKRYVRKDGTIVWANLTVGCVRKADNAVDYFISVIQDITDRKQAEARLAERNAQLDLAHKAARVGSYTYDLVAGTMRISRASAAIWDISRDTMEIGSKQWCARVHRDDMQRLRAEHIRAFKERRCELVNEFRFVRPGGEVRWIEARSLIAYNGAGRAERMTGVYIDVTERRIAEDHKNLLIAELDHRVKNALACVAAVAQQSRECSKSADHFLEVLNGRINSLANAHALLSRSRWEGVGVGELVRSELARCTSDGDHLIEGPDIVLAAEATQPLAMVLHELTTNATKYGALSNRRGRVSVCWGRQSNCDSQECLALEWRETGGPRVVGRGPSGYGSSVIRDLIPYELGGSVDYVLAPEGVRCRVELPTKWLRNGVREGANRDKTARYLQPVS